MATALKVFAALPRHSKLKPRGFNVSLEVIFCALEKQTEIKVRWHDMEMNGFQPSTLAVPIRQYLIGFWPIGQKKRTAESKRRCRLHLEA
jgi:hypothetical protein